MSKTEYLKEYLKICWTVVRVSWQLLVVPFLYGFLMWGFMVVAAFLFLGDLLQAAGIVSAVTLANMIKSEFYKEFYGSRNPQRAINAIQEQSKRK